jgi:ATP-dependent Lon protease
MDSQILPLFPLSIVVFPGEELKLHIFEPRYKQLIHDCKKDGLSFGIPPYIEGKSLYVGTELKLKEIKTVYEDGKMDIIATGIGWFEIAEFYRILHGKLYPGGKIIRKTWDIESDIVLSARLVGLIEELYHIMKITNVPIPDAQAFKTHIIGHKLGLNIEQEIHLLTLGDEVSKQKYLISHLESLIPILVETENLRKKAEMNGHFQNIIPPGL